MPAKPGSSIAVLVALCALHAGAQAQGWPTKTVRIIVPFTAGSGTDIIARTVTEKLSPQLGQPIVIENRPGAG
ncbi:MAG TPA: tripartite tricarboxylate transporter substrate binding protein, partial [Burkholderiales bacterium]|nr:tripartite tricarboxylate transporter substrate binding protein [Burkholderiales bacterium]